MTAVRKSDLIATLQADILRLQGFKPAEGHPVDLGLAPLRQAFPNESFPLAAIHEFCFSSAENLATTYGFISCLLSTLMSSSGMAVWVGCSKSVFPPGLKNFGVDPDRIIFVHLRKEQEAMWAIEEALKCTALTAVVGEIQDLSFIASRRLQLAVEQSQVTGFILRKESKKHGVTASVSRWRITSLPSHPIDDLPGIGNPSWKTEILKIRNGKPGIWELLWQNERFVEIGKSQPSKTILIPRAG